MPSFLRFYIAYSLIVVSVGAGAAGFLRGLDWVVGLRLDQSWWILLAPVAGLIMFIVFSRMPASWGHANTLFARRLRGDGGQALVLGDTPANLAPTIVLTTWLSHLVGASVGREGTAVQMAGGLAGIWARFLRVGGERHQWELLFIALAAGFGSVFGVPVTGVVFALELSGGTSRFRQAFKVLRPRVLVLSWLGSWVADQVARSLGARHVVYPSYEVVFKWSEFLSFRSLWGHFLAALLFGILAWVFLSSVRRLRKILVNWVPRADFRILLGSVVIAAMWFFPKAWRYAGLGTELIAEGLVKPLPFSDAGWKLFATAFSIATGFKGGEVTPLMAIGASAGSAFAGSLSLAPQLFASLGLVAVFGAASGLPLACAVMAGELMGGAILPIALPICFMAHWVCRHPRLYDV